MGYTKYCQASSPNSNFTCYGLSANTDFNLFLQQAEASQLECNSGEYNETGYPAYSYSVIMSKREGKESTTYMQEGFSDMQEFNVTKALMGTMSTNFEAWTNAPTVSPTLAASGSPTDAPIANTGCKAAIDIFTTVMAVLMIWF